MEGSIKWFWVIIGAIVLVWLVTSCTPFVTSNAKYKFSNPTTETELIAEIMEIPGEIDQTILDFNKETKSKQDKYKGIREELVQRLKTDLRKLHAINPEKANKIVDENFPSLWGGGGMAPIWKKPVTAPAPVVPAVANTGGIQKK